MTLTENVSLAALTTFRIGGTARYIAVCESVEDLQTALAFARERGLPWYVIGGGSNILANDKGYEGVIIQPLLKGLHFKDATENSEGTENNIKTPDSMLVECGAGEVWDSFVQECTERNLWGLENLAGIPGWVGGAPVQNIGAYGVDVSQTIHYVDVLNTKTNELERITNTECAFGYRDSIFKNGPASKPLFIIVRVAFLLQKEGSPQTSYTDLAAYEEKNGVLENPIPIARAVREIRSSKFPDLRETGTAGSFFKNPTISADVYAALLAKYPGIPGFPAEGSTGSVKVSLAWILDKVLGMRGYAQGSVRLFEQQPLVLVAEKGATAIDVNALAKEVEEKVFNETNIRIEREVRML
jgi:UDP-N-acetylmuramate dehydrogenase